MFKKLAQRIKSEFPGFGCSLSSNPLKKVASDSLSSLSKHALSLYERKCDVNKFAKLVLSDPENHSHESQVAEMFSKQGIEDPFSEEKLFELSENKRFLEDLGI